MQNKLKYIFSNNIIQNIDLLFKETCFSYSHISFTKKSISNFIACWDLDKGYLLRKCFSCGHSHKISLTCKSRLCPSCSFKYSATWTEKISRDIIKCPHRHILFTIPEQCREFFFYNRTLLSKFAYAVNHFFKYQFHNIHRKNQRVSQIPKASDQYFIPSDIIHDGLITVIHSFGRNHKWNPHIHAIVSLSGFNKFFHFVNFQYFHAESIANQWKFLVLDIISNGKYHNRHIHLKAKNTVNLLYKIDKRFFFGIGNGHINNNKRIIKYLGRYLARAPITEYKISSISHDSFSFFFMILN